MVFRELRQNGQRSLAVRCRDLRAAKRVHDAASLAIDRLADFVQCPGSLVAFPHGFNRHAPSVEPVRQFGGIELARETGLQQAGLHFVAQLPLVRVRILDARAELLHFRLSHGKRALRLSKFGNPVGLGRAFGLDSVVLVHRQLEVVGGGVVESAVVPLPRQVALLAGCGRGFVGDQTFGFRHPGH